MDKNVPTSQQIGRERAAYAYLEALDAGDIDAIIEVLQQAVYDAPLENMVLDAHQAYFQAEQNQSAQYMTEIETQIELPAITDLPAYSRPGKSRRHRSRWAQILAAVLIVAVLIGGFVSLLTLHNAGSNNTAASSTPTRSIQVCNPYPWKQFQFSSAIEDLISVAVVSANDAWAVGQESTTRPVIAHWDGQSWQPLDSPFGQGNETSNSALFDVAAVSSNDVWAVGYSWQGSSVPAGQSLVSISQTLVEHWDGTNWKVVPSPNGPTGSGVLNAVSIVSSDNIWADGSYTDTNGRQQPLVEHWDGTDWQFVHIQTDSTLVSGFLVGITTSAQGDVWVTGLGSEGIATVVSGLVGHWDGSQWQWLPAPPHSLIVDSLSVISATNLWVLGSGPEGSGSGGNALMEHWDGQQWSMVSLPVEAATLAKLAIVSANNMWVVGSTQDSNGGSQLLVLHWDGKVWQTVSMPAQNTGANDIAIEHGQTWIVGGSTDPTSLILGQLTCP